MLGQQQFSFDLRSQAFPYAFSINLGLLSMFYFLKISPGVFFFFADYFYLIEKYMTIDRIPVNEFCYEVEILQNHTISTERLKQP